MVFTSFPSSATLAIQGKYRFTTVTLNAKYLSLFITDIMFLLLQEKNSCAKRKNYRGKKKIVCFLINKTFLGIRYLSARTALDGSIFRSEDSNYNSIQCIQYHGLKSTASPNFNLRPFSDMHEAKRQTLLGGKKKVKCRSSLTLHIHEKQFELVKESSCTASPSFRQGWSDPGKKSKEILKPIPSFFRKEA